MGHQTEQQTQTATDVETGEHTQTSGLAAKDDYQSELIPYSRASALAAAGDSGAHQEDGGYYRPFPIALDPSHAIEMSERFRRRAEAYNVSRLGHGGDAAAYKEASAAADQYQADADNLKQADIEYNAFVPLAAFAVDEVIRFKMIQAGLSGDLDDAYDTSLSKESLSHQVADRKGEFAEALHSGDIKTNKGVVTDAAGGFIAAQAALYEVLYRLRGVEMRELVSHLEAERAEKTEDKQKINEKIEAAGRIFEGVSQFLGKGEDVVGAHKIGEEGGFEKVEGAIAIGKLAADVGGFVAGRISWAMHDKELALIDAQLSTLDNEIASTQQRAAKQEHLGLHEAFRSAVLAYKPALSRYENAIASRRTAYAKAGATADTLHAHGHDVKHGEDKASQAMLFISAGRETAVVLDNALEPGRHAETQLHQTLTDMNHRGRSVMIDDWERVPGEPNSNDRQLAFAAYGMTTRWVDASEQESKAFNRVDAIAADMLGETGKTSGDY